MNLVDNARDWWRWNSTHVVAVFAAAPIAWEQLPEDIKAYVPAEWMPYIGIIMFLGFLVARLRAQ